MTPERLAEIEGRLEETTPGPWREGPNNYILPQGTSTEWAFAMVFGHAKYEDDQIEGNKAFIVHSWQDVKDLLAEVRFLHSLLADARSESDMYRQGYLEGQRAIAERVQKEVGDELFSWTQIKLNRVLVPTLYEDKRDGQT